MLKLYYFASHQSFKKTTSARTLVVMAFMGGNMDLVMAQLGMKGATHSFTSPSI